LQKKILPIDCAKFGQRLFLRGRINRAGKFKVNVEILVKVKPYTLRNLFDPVETVASDLRVVSNNTIVEIRNRKSCLDDRQTASDVQNGEASMFGTRIVPKRPEKEASPGARGFVEYCAVQIEGTVVKVRHNLIELFDG
jgi:hypothetical protein